MSKAVVVSLGRKGQRTLARRWDRRCGRGLDCRSLSNDRFPVHVWI